MKLSKHLLIFLIATAIGVGTVYLVITHASMRTTPPSQPSATLDEAIALIDSWQGDPAVLARAKAKLDTVLKAEPESAAAHREYARYHLSRGYLNGNSVTPDALAAAQRSLSEALRLEPGYADAYVLLGHVYFLQSRLDDAWNALTKAKSIGTAEPWLPLNIAEVQVAQGKFDEAASTYQSVLESHPGHSRAVLAAFAGLLNVYMSTGQNSQAEEIFKRKIAFDPDYAWSYGNYGAFLLCIKDDADEAIPQFRQALRLMDYGVARIGLASALYRKLATPANTTPHGNSSELLLEAQSLDAGDPVDVINTLCRGGPAVAAVARAADLASPVGR